MSGRGGRRIYRAGASGGGGGRDKRPEPSSGWDHGGGGGYSSRQRSAAVHPPREGAAYRGGAKLQKTHEIRPHTSSSAQRTPTVHRASGPLGGGAFPVVQSKTSQVKRKSYVDKWQKCIDAEFSEEMKEVEERMRSWPVDKLQREGFALFDLSARPTGSLFDDVVLKFYYDDGASLPTHKFMNGDMVSISSSDPQRNRSTFEGTVSERTRAALMIVVREYPVDLTERYWRLDKRANKIVHDRMTAALAIIASPLPPPLPADTNVPEEFRPDQNSKTANVFQSIIVDKTSGSKELAEAPSILDSLHSSAKFPSNFSQWKLNESQRSTINTVLHRKLSLIQGPPGTGKTHTAVHLLRLLAHLYKGKKIPILACAYTNVATDNLLEGLLDCGVKALRVGRPVKVREELRDATLDAHLERHKFKAALERHRNEILAMTKQQIAATGASRAEITAQLASTRAKIREISRKAVHDIMKTVEVICCTCIGAGDELLKSTYFPFIVIDECTQASEPAVLVPLTIGVAQQVVLIGDHHQLPPTVKSDEAREGGLPTSLFSRLLADANLEVQMLQIQYRMHPKIAEFPAEHFYDGKLRTGVRGSDRPRLPHFPWPHHKPIVFIQTTGDEGRSKDGKSKYNPVEAALVTLLAKHFLKYGVTKDQMGLITPYVGQIRQIVTNLGQDAEMKQLIKVVMDEADEEAGEWRDTQVLGGLNVASVDGFQGREKELIIFSAVRSNAKGKLGFLTDWRRLNVALTRARRGLIIVGDEKTLQYDEHWKAYIEWLRKNDLIVPSSYVKAGLRDGFAAAIQRLSRNDPIPEEKNPLAGFSDISGSQEDDEESEVKQEVSLNDEEDEEDAQEAPSVESEENYDMMDSAYADDVNDAPQNENEEEDAGYNDNSLENNIEGEEEKQQEGAAEGIRSPSPSSSMEEQDNQSIDLDEDATNQIAAKGMDQGVILAEPDTMAQLIKPDPYIHERVSYNDLPTQVMKQNPHEDSNTSTDKMLEPEDSAPDTPERAAAVGEDQEGFAADIQL